MSLKASATRYARALFDVVVANGDLDKVGRDLSTFTALTAEHADLQAALTSPRVPAAARVTLVTTIAERAGAEAPVTRLLALLAERGKLALLPFIVPAYDARLLAHRQIVRAGVTTATPMSPAHEDRLRERLSEATGAKVHVDLAVDPALIGGVVARIGSTVYDGSVRTQLGNVRRQLAAG